MKFASLATGLAIFGDNLYKTIDGGSSWIPSLTDVKYFSDFSSSGTCYLITNEDQIFKSTDYGSNWSLVFESATGALFLEIEHLESGLVVAGSAAGSLMISRDNGVSWKYATISDPLTIHDYFFREIEILDDNTVVACGDRENGNFVMRITLPAQ